MDKNISGLPVLTFLNGIALAQVAGPKLLENCEIIILINEMNTIV